MAQQMPRIGISLTPPGETQRMIDAFEHGDVHVLEDEGKPIAAIHGHLAKVPGQPDRVRFHLSVNPTSSRWSEWPAARAGRWRIAIANGSDAPLSAHLYIQRDDTPLGYVQHGRQSCFDHDEGYERAVLDGSYTEPGRDCPMTREGTLSALATGAGALVVAAVDDAGEPAEYSASGPTPGRAEPDCAGIADQGPAHWGVLAAGTWSGSVVAMRGTSVAAPQLVRRLADYLESLQPGPVLEWRAVTDGPVASSDVPPPPGAAVLEPIKQGAVAASSPDKARIGSFILRPSSHPGLPPRTYPRSPDSR